MKQTNFITLFLAALCLLSATAIAAPLQDDHGHSGGHTMMSAAIKPSWNLTDASNKQVSNSLFVGRAHVLVLHLGKGCLHCAQQLQTISQRTADFHRADLEVIAVSTDPVNELAKQLQEAGDSISLQHFFSDPKLKLFKTVGALDKETKKPLHATLLVDATGKIRWSNIGSAPFVDMDQLLKEAQYVSSGSTTTQEDDDPGRPRLFLNKSDSIVAFQLDRLSNQRLLMAPRKADDKAYVPVWTAILTRAGIPIRYRRQALNALAKLKGGSVARQLLTALKAMDCKTSGEKADCRELATMLVKLPKGELVQIESALLKSVESKNRILSQAAFAALATTGAAEKAGATSQYDTRKRINWLRSIGLIQDQAIRDSFQAAVFDQVKTAADPEVRSEAISAMRYFPANQVATWDALSPLVAENDLRDSVVETLLSLPVSTDSTKVTSVAQTLLQQIESLPASNRTKPNEIRAMQLAQKLVSSLNQEQPQVSDLEKRIKAISVQVVTINTVHEEMRYDVPFFAVEAGRPVQIILDNQDLMPHNLIVCEPGTLKQVAKDGLKAGTRRGKDGKHYVPRTNDVLHATDMVPANEKERLTFTAPKQTGEYPYVCTFPQHWSRMYGVMVVVDDLEKWQLQPTQPKDPLGNTRQLVKKWTIEDFSEDLKQGLDKRSVEAGKRIFTEATCSQCHQLAGFGGAGVAVGPILDGVYKKYRANRQLILNQILQPSSYVDPKYQMFIIATEDGLTRRGLIVSQNEETIELLESGSVSETIKIPKEEIEEMAASKTSIMPKALLDNFTKEEILDLMSYIESNQQ